jgi:tetratricopeptide (TPR) repeat protein/predicted aspartyl protease
VARARRFGVLLLLFALAPGANVFAARCKLARVELQVTMIGLRPLVHAQINGTDALFVLDSGAFYSSLTPAAAAQYRLPQKAAPQGLTVYGVGGSTRPSVATVKTFTLASQPIHDIEFLVLGNDVGNGAAGLLGQNVLRIGDLEYDLANGVIRFVHAEDCKGAMLAYWAAAGADYSMMDIEATTTLQSHTRGVGYVNGKEVRVTFDTGASVSTLSLEAAKRAGVTPESPGVVSGGWMHGIGREYEQTWIAPFASFRLGDEEIHNTKLRIGALGRDADMLIGADFFLSHHIYVASGQRKLFFTYNGGPVFNLSTTPVPASAAAAASSAEAATAPGLPATSTQPAVAGAGAAAAIPGIQPAAPLEATALARRGSASAARHDYEHALADLNRACELAPGDASCFYERGLAHWGNKQPDLALADFSEAIRLRPDDVQSLVARARLRASRHDPGDTVAADLDAADRAAPKESDARLVMGDLYQYARQYPAAVVQYSKWIESHPDEDADLPLALNGRCWSRAQWGEQLEQALADCDRVLKRYPKAAPVLDSRGLVHLRQGSYDKAIADYDAALRLQPKIAWSLYGRGLAKLRKGLAGDGQADIAAATALDPKITETAGKQGIGP